MFSSSSSSAARATKHAMWAGDVPQLTAFVDRYRADAVEIIELTAASESVAGSTVMTISGLNNDTTMPSSASALHAANPIVLLFKLDPQAPPSQLFITDPTALENTTLKWFGSARHTASPITSISQLVSMERSKLASRDNRSLHDGTVAAPPSSAASAAAVPVDREALLMMLLVERPELFTDECQQRAMGGWGSSFIRRSGGGNNGEGRHRRHFTPTFRAPTAFVQVDVAELTRLTMPSSPSSSADASAISVAAHAFLTKVQHVLAIKALFPPWGAGCSSSAAPGEGAVSQSPTNCHIGVMDGLKSYPSRFAARFAMSGETVWDKQFDSSFGSSAQSPAFLLRASSTHDDNGSSSGGDVLQYRVMALLNADLPPIHLSDAAYDELSMGKRAGQSSASTDNSQQSQHSQQSQQPLPHVNHHISPLPGEASLQSVPASSKKNREKAPRPNVPQVMMVRTRDGHILPLKLPKALGHELSSVQQAGSAEEGGGSSAPPTSWISTLVTEGRVSDGLFQTPAVGGVAHGSTQHSQSQLVWGNSYYSQSMCGLSNSCFPLPSADNSQQSTIRLLSASAEGSSVGPPSQSFSVHSALALATPFVLPLVDVRNLETVARRFNTHEMLLRRRQQQQSQHQQQQQSQQLNISSQNANTSQLALLADASHADASMIVPDTIISPVHAQFYDAIDVSNKKLGVSMPLMRYMKPSSAVAAGAAVAADGDSSSQLAAASAVDDDGDLRNILLIVDEHPANRDVARSRSLAMGFDAIAAPRGEEDLLDRQLTASVLKGIAEASSQAVQRLVSANLDTCLLVQQRRRLLHMATGGGNNGNGSSSGGGRGRSSSSSGGSARPIPQPLQLFGPHIAASIAKIIHNSKDEGFKAQAWGLLRDLPTPVRRSSSSSSSSYQRQQGSSSGARGRSSRRSAHDSASQHEVYADSTQLSFLSSQLSSTPLVSANGSQALAGDLDQLMLSSQQQASSTSPSSSSGSTFLHLAASSQSSQRASSSSFGQHSSLGAAARQKRTNEAPAQSETETNILALFIAAASALGRGG